jgi:HEAT repeats
VNFQEKFEAVTNAFLAQESLDSLDFFRDLLTDFTPDRLNGFFDYFFQQFSRFDQNHKVAAIDSLISIAASPRISRLNFLLNTESDPFILGHTCWIIEQFGDESSVAPLINLLRKTESEDVCTEAILALYRIRSKEAIEFLENVMSGLAKTACSQKTLAFLRNLP